MLFLLFIYMSGITIHISKLSGGIMLMISRGLYDFTIVNPPNILADVLSACPEPAIFNSPYVA